MVCTGKIDNCLMLSSYLQSFRIISWFLKEKYYYFSLLSTKPDVGGKILSLTTQSQHRKVRGSAPQDCPQPQMLVANFRYYHRLNPKTQLYCSLACSYQHLSHIFPYTLLLPLSLNSDKGPYGHNIPWWKPKLAFKQEQLPRPPDQFELNPPTHTCADVT